MRRSVKLVHTLAPMRWASESTITPARFFKFIDVRTAFAVLETGRRRWSSPLKWDDQEEFRRMPRFEPSLAAAMDLLPRRLLDIAQGRVRCDQARLTPNALFLVRAARVMLDRGSSEDVIAKLWSRGFGDPDGKLDRGLRQFFNRSDLETTRVFCVTDSIANRHLWENYAEGGHGCVLEFRHVPQLGTPLVMARPVRYSHDGPRFDGALDFLLYGGGREFKEGILRGVCLSKGIRYQPEREWRVVTWAPEESGRLHADYTFPATELVSVNLGPLFDRARLAELRSVLRPRYPHAVVLRMPSSYDASAMIRLAGEGGAW